MTVVVTGASGFVGRQVCRVLAESGREVRAIVRRAGSVGILSGPRFEERVVPDLFDSSVACNHWMEGAAAVVHLAAKVHQGQSRSPSLQAAYLRENAATTHRLAMEAVRARVPRFVFMSSVKAVAERSSGTPIRIGSTPRPEDAYGRSKLAAEQALGTLASAHGLQVAVIRPPLVYGPEVRANFRALVRMVASGVPLPFARVENRRSIVSVWNLADFVVRCLDSLPSRFETLHVADERVVSTPALISLIGEALGRNPRLLSVPPASLASMFRAIGRGAWVDRLLGSLEIDTAESYRRLAWCPRVATEEGVIRAVREMVR